MLRTVSRSHTARWIASTALCLPVLALVAQTPDPASVTITKSASYTPSTDGMPYAFLPSPDSGFYMLLGGLQRPPKALHFDASGHKGRPLTGIDLTRRSTDIAHWYLSEGKIFSVVFSPPEETGDGEIIWGFVDPEKKDPAEPHTIGKVPAGDKTAPSTWASSSMQADDPYVFWVVPHMTKKTCASIAVASADMRKGTADVRDIELPFPVTQLKVMQVTTNAGGDRILSVSGDDSRVKKTDGFTEHVSFLIHWRADGTLHIKQVSSPGLVAGCMACLLDNSGQAECAGFAMTADKTTPAILHARADMGSDAPIEWTVDALDAERTRQLADRAHDAKEMAETKAPKPDVVAKERATALTEAIARMRPIRMELLPGDTILFVGEVQVRNEYLGDPSNAMSTGNLRDQILYALIPTKGEELRTGVVRKYLVEEGMPGYGDVTRTALMYDHGRMYFFFNDYQLHAYGAGAAPTDKYARCNLATIEGAGIFDPMMQVDGPEGPIERSPLNISREMDYMMNGIAMQVAPGIMLVAISKARTIQFLKVQPKH